MRLSFFKSSLARVTSLKGRSSFLISSKRAPKPVIENLVAETRRNQFPGQFGEIAHSLKSVA